MVPARRDDTGGGDRRSGRAAGLAPRRRRAIAGRTAGAADQPSDLGIARRVDGVRGRGDQRVVRDHDPLVRSAGDRAENLPMTPWIVAHDGPHLASEMWRHWTFEPVTAALLLLSAVCYALGLKRLWSRAGAGHGIRRWEAGCFFAALATIAVALLSPLVWVSELLFSAHMTQHELLML